MSGEYRQPEFFAKDPAGSVPQLDDGTTISECTAITEYIDGVFDGPNLTCSTPKEHAVIPMMQRRAEAGLLDAVVACFHHATEGLGPELETDRNKL